MRIGEAARQTKETEITVRLDLDGGQTSVHTGIGFFDHMLTALSVHGGLGLSVECRGDLEVDSHHTVEDTGIVIGMALREVLGDRSGIARYGSARIPMDEALACCDIDISGRPYLVFHCDFRGERIGEMDTQMVPEFFRALAFHAGITLHLNLSYGENDHHKAEALFKAFAHALRAAAAPSKGLLSTKGIL